MAGAHPYESKSDEELFELAFQPDTELDDDYEAETAWAAIRLLRRRNTAQVFALAKEYCASQHLRHRERALQVLAQMGGGSPLAERPHLQASVDLAVSALQDQHLAVAQAAAWALAHLRGEVAVQVLIQLETHPDADIRRAVATGLAGSNDPEATLTLLRLMEDSEDEVRNWATFSLGMRPSPDSTEIREAFRKRLADSFEPARNEGLWALARRKDPRGLQLLLARFESGAAVRGDRTVALNLLDLDSDATSDEVRNELSALVNAPEPTLL
jgi:HEAT repeat protein